MLVSPSLPTHPQLLLHIIISTRRSISIAGPTEEHIRLGVTDIKYINQITHLITKSEFKTMIFLLYWLKFVGYEIFSHSLIHCNLHLILNESSFTKQ